MTIEEYVIWLRSKHNIRVDSRTENYYSIVVNEIRRRFEESGTWIAVLEGLPDLDRRYVLDTRYDLFPGTKTPTLQTKEFKEFLLKTFRKNVLENPTWPEEPEEGWVLPDSDFAAINDLVRCRFVVKYLDGVSTLLNWIGSVCQGNKIQFNVDYEAKEEGYYAAHGYVAFSCHIPVKEFDTTQIDVQIELQVTTQVQDLIYKLLHKYYEVRRQAPSCDGICWQWDYESEEFAANYLGHILHYVEGMIMDIRKSQEDGNET